MSGFSRSYDDAKTTEPEPYRGGQAGHRVSFRYACDGLLDAITKASRPGHSLTEDTFREADAVWFARHVAGEARRLGLV